MKKKILLIASAVAGAIVVLSLGTLALFTARTDSDFSAKAGTVTIDLKNLDITNCKNLNPGDNDPSNPDGAVAGTDHKFTYDVYNTGNKSIRTRQTIILTVDEAGDSKELLDARYLSLFNDEKEITEKYYVLKDDSVKTTISDNDFVKAVKYVFISDVFDGKGTDITKGGDAEKESVVNVVKQNDSGDVKKTYSYDFSLLRNASNKYQGADINASVTIEAMQYRNTDEKDWSQSAIVVRDYSSAKVTLNVVPASNEDKTGNVIDKK